MSATSTATPSGDDPGKLASFLVEEIGLREPSPPSFADKAKDLQALRDAVVDGASIGNGLWLSYVFVLLYLAVAASGITHRDLLLENPVKLPFLNVDLPLAGFLWFGPALLLVVHAYVLLHFSMLADKMTFFRCELEAQITSTDAQLQLRRQLPSNIFLQIGAGPDDMRQGFKGIALQVIVWISLVICPLAVFTLFILQFLPFHNELATTWQRLILTSDVIILWILWPPITRGERAWFDRNSIKITLTTASVFLLSISSMVFVFFVATFPGELLYENNSIASIQQLRKYLFEGAINYTTYRPNSIFSNRLVLPGIDLIDHAKFDTDAKIAVLPESISLRGRSLEGAIFASARMRKADFTGAHLQGAEFLRADLRGARFECGGDDGAECADLRGAYFGRAVLQGAFFDGAQLEGADFHHAQLQGASFVDALLQGASLKEAQLKGALFINAQLQGASFVGAQLQDAVFANAFAWGADLPKNASEGMRVFAPELQAKYRGLDCSPNAKAPLCDWSERSFAALKAVIDRWVAEEDRSGSLNRIASLEPKQSGTTNSDKSQIWLTLSQQTLNDEAEFSKRLQEISCNTTYAFYSSRGIVHRISVRFKDNSTELVRLAGVLLDPKQCAGSSGLSDRNKFDLEEILDNARTIKAAR